MALLNARNDWFPQLKGVFTYASHTGASTMLGYPPQTVLPIQGDVPVLLLGGTEDGVIASSAKRYGGGEGDPVSTIQRTLELASPNSNHPHHMVILDGANHFSIVDKVDTTMARNFLDRAEKWDANSGRSFILQLIHAFLTEYGLATGDGGFMRCLSNGKDNVSEHRQIVPVVGDAISQVCK